MQREEEEEKNAFRAHQTQNKSNGTQTKTIINGLKL